MRTREPEVQQFVSQNPQPQPQIWCVLKNLKFSNLFLKNPYPNPNNLPQPQPRSENLKLSNVSCKNPNSNPNPNNLPQPQPHTLVRTLEPEVQQFVTHKHKANHTFGAYASTESSQFVFQNPQNPTQIPTPYLNPNHTFGAYTRTWNSANYLARYTNENFNP